MKRWERRRELFASASMRVELIECMEYDVHPVGHGLGCRAGIEPVAIVVTTPEASFTLGLDGRAATDDAPAR